MCQHSRLSDHSSYNKNCFVLQTPRESTDAPPAASEGRPLAMFEADTVEGSSG